MGLWGRDAACSQRRRTSSTPPRLAHGASARHASCLRPGLPRPATRSVAAGIEVRTLCGWGGRLHGFWQPLWGGPSQIMTSASCLTSGSPDCPTRRKPTEPLRLLAPKPALNPNPLRPLTGYE